ncbi:MAG: carbohydrate-binding protein [Sedimentisphaerales bacterium]|nr:carbohydrate-binding protein [Sedimentisphaerales bacterium]
MLLTTYIKKRFGFSLKQMEVLFALILFMLICLGGTGRATIAIPADYTGDQKVTLADFSVVAENWLEFTDTDDLDRCIFHWLMDATVAPEVSIQTVYTDKSRYEPGQQSVITVICSNDSDSAYQGWLSLNITHHGHSVHTNRQGISIDAFGSDTKTFAWTVPASDFEGYLVEAWLNNGACVVTAIDVSSDWKRYPRYGYVTEFYSSTSTGRNTEIMDELSRDYHINSLQYYDWMWRHENVIKRNYVGNILSPWLDWRGASISFDILQDSIAKANARAMAPMSYFQIYLGLDDYEAISGVSPQWGLYADTGHTNQYYHDAGVYMWLFNPGNSNWQNHLFGEYEDALVTMNWAGIHLDQLGNIGGGVYYDYWGGGINLVSALGNMLDNSKDELDTLETVYPEVQGRDALIFNIVDGGVGYWAVDTVLASNVDVIYSELWGNYTYGGVKDFVRYARANSGGKAVILAAYINQGEETGGYFDADSVLLADAAFFACGAFHLELGDGEYMLAQEYFPARDKLIGDDLRARLRDYYNFITAYERLLFDPDLRCGDGGLQWISATGYSLSGDGYGNTLWFLNRGTGTFEIFHLINLLGNDNQWRNVAATPAVQQDIPVKLRLGPDADVTGVYLASPDSDGGILHSIPYTLGSDSQGDYVSITVPRLEYWDMIYVERTVNPPANDRYEAEDANKWYVGVNTDHGGYSGTGFVDQYAEVNDSVNFYVVIPQAGDYTFTFRYANGDSNGDRSLIVNGDIQGDINFNTTGNWDTWSTGTREVSLEPGVHQVTLYYGSWNSGAINLDYLEIQ